MEQMRKEREEKKEQEVPVVSRPSTFPPSQSDIRGYFEKKTPQVLAHRTPSDRPNLQSTSRSSSSSSASSTSSFLQPSAPVADTVHLCLGLAYEEGLVDPRPHVLCDKEKDLRNHLFRTCMDNPAPKKKRTRTSAELGCLPDPEIEKTAMSFFVVMQNEVKFQTHGDKKIIYVWDSRTRLWVKKSMAKQDDFSTWFHNRVFQKLMNRFQIIGSNGRFKVGHSWDKPGVMKQLSTAIFDIGVQHPDSKM